MQSIRPAQKHDLPKILTLWNTCLMYDRVNPALLEGFFDTSYYDPDGVLVAKVKNNIVGFIIAIGQYEENGWIPLILVHPQHLSSGIGDSLLHEAESYLGGKAVKDIRVEPYGAEARFFTGIDTRYVELIELLRRNGFHVTDDSQVDIVKDLTGFERPAWVTSVKQSLEEQGFSFDYCEPHLRQAFLKFMAIYFGGYGGWMIETRKYIEQAGDPRLRILAFRSGEIVGFTAYAKEYDWYIWSTGVREDLRGKKIGSVLVFLALTEMKRRGATRMCVSDCPIEFYKVVEGEIMRRYVMMAKSVRPVTSRPEALS
jgi:ribosomal protein S18 acetylase RimI-like enzyme